MEVPPDAASIDSQFYLSAEEFFAAHHQLALTYDDVTLSTAYSEILPRDTQLDTYLGESLHLNIPIISADMDTVTELDDALKKLETLDARQSQIVELRYFGGLSLEETAAALDLSLATVKRDLRTARAWLATELTREAIR